MSDPSMISIGAKGVLAVSRSSIGKKLLMAATGLAFIGFVTGHMLGNLQIFLGPDRLNSYAETLQHLGALLWVIRLTLAVFLIVHVWTGIQLYLHNRRSRPIRYIREDTVQASVSSRTMIFSGLGILLYVVYHLLHFTFLVTNPEYSGLVDAEGRFDVYSMVVLGFGNCWISGVYILASAALALHISHAVPSLFQTLGLGSDTWYRPLKLLGNIAAIILFFGYVSIPVSVLIGVIQPAIGGN